MRCYSRQHQPDQVRMILTLAETEHEHAASRWRLHLQSRRPFRTWWLGLRANRDPAGRVGQPGLDNSAWTLVRGNNDQQIVWELCLSLKHHLVFFHFRKLDFWAKRDSFGR